MSLAIQAALNGGHSEANDTMGLVIFCIIMASTGMNITVGVFGLIQQIYSAIRNWHRNRNKPHVETKISEAKAITQNPIQISNQNFNIRSLYNNEDNRAALDSSKMSNLSIRDDRQLSAVKNQNYISRYIL